MKDSVCVCVHVCVFVQEQVAAVVGGGREERSEGGEKVWDRREQGGNEHQESPIEIQSSSSPGAARSSRQRYRRTLSQVRTSQAPSVLNGCLTFYLLTASVE